MIFGFDDYRRDFLGKIPEETEESQGTLQVGLISDFEEQLERARPSIWRASRLAYEDYLRRCSKLAERNYIQNINL